MSFKNVNVANFNFILRLKLPKLQISQKVNLVTFKFCKLHFYKVVKCLLKMLTLLILILSQTKIAKVANILESELSNFQILQTTLLQSCQMSFKNVSVANFNFILRLKLPKLQISQKVNLVTFKFCKLHFYKVVNCLLKMLTLLILILS